MPAKFPDDRIMKEFIGQLVADLFSGHPNGEISFRLSTTTQSAAPKAVLKIELLSAGGKRSAYDQIVSEVYGTVKPEGLAEGISHEILKHHFGR